MKILLLANPASTHTQKWAQSLSVSGQEIIVFGINEYDPKIYAGFSNIKVISVNFDASINKNAEGSKNKLFYLKALPLLRRTIKDFAPDIVHAHYATSYGLLGALCGFRPFVLSVWGSDVFTFPNISFLHKWLLIFNLYKADKLLSTSHVMAVETNKYSLKSVEVTPFGIDLSAFKPESVISPFAPGDIVIGTVKTLEEKYGIEYLIRAFHKVRSRYANLPLKLLLVGGGSLEASLKALTIELNIEDCTIFTGRIPFVDVPKYHNILSVYVSVSVCNSESFGVAVLESSACGKPVIVSNVGGLPEVVEDNVTGIVVQARDTEQTANAIERLVLDAELRAAMGRAGRERVQRLYEWNANVKQMIEIYENISVLNQKI
jgi:glycosyltransferase involved in cell wall biosynthesis